MRRHSVNKQSAARSFRKDSMRTKGANMAGPSMRGGWRL